MTKTVTIITIIICLFCVVLPASCFSYSSYVVLSIGDAVTELPGGKCSSNGKEIDCEDMVTTSSYIMALAPSCIAILCMICATYASMSM